MGSAVLPNRANGLYRIFTSQSSVHKVNWSAWMAARDPKTPGARFSEKKRLNFLKFIVPVTPLWVLYPSEIMRVGFTEPLLAIARFTRSIKVLR